MNNNIIIEASAGTGKTFSLATRFIKLLASGKVRPDQIIALTFSRAATQEIYSKLAQRLADAASADAASNDNAAAIESARIGVNLSARDFATILAKVIDCQHVGSISTIDSFILRMIRFFPLELGFQGNVDILDTYDSEEEKRKACRSLMTSSSGTAEFVNAFHETMTGDSRRSFASELKNGIKKWTDFLLDHPESATWTAESMFQAANIDVANVKIVNVPEELETYAVASEPEREMLNDFLEFYGNYNGGPDIVPASGLAAKIVEAFTAGNELNTITFNRKPIVFSNTVAAAMKKDLLNAFTLHVVIKMRQMAGMLKLVSQVDARYNASTRSHGRLTFGDLPRVLSGHADFEVENLQFRFDEKFDHWAIDEFQDTSRAQWNCLNNLVNNAASGDAGRTVTIVGDIKQAIYAWRGGDENIFIDIARRKDFIPQQLAASYRYGKNTVDLLNRVFSSDNLRADGLLDKARHQAIDKWLDKNSWMEHKVPAERSQNDYVCVLGVEPKSRGAEGPNPVLEKTVELVKDLWKRRSGNNLTDKTLAVLVRSNDKGRELADVLRSEGVPAVFEGENADIGHPVVAAFLSLLHFSEHPDDTYDKEVIFRTPIHTVFAPDVNGSDDAALLASLVSRDISHLGYVRTLRKYIGKCRENGSGLDEYSQIALDRLILAASKYEARGEAEGGVDRFIDYFASMSVRDNANPAVVTIITIHRSKGLGYDWVVVPIIESGSVEKMSTQDNLYGHSWVLPYMKSEICEVFPELKKSRNLGCDDALLANLHTYYVALSRNKEGLWIIAENKAPGKKVSDTRYFRNILFNGLGISPGADNSVPLYEQPTGGDPSMWSASVKNIVVKTSSTPFVFPKVKGKIKRKTPSHGFFHSDKPRKASSLFDSDFGKAAERGTELHALLAGIEWLDKSAGQPEEIPESEIRLSADSPFRNALLKPDGCVDLWRERSFELMVNKEWISGTFDRVVFLNKDGKSIIEIYDYKTNAIRPGESQLEFESRMRDEYAGQMSAYREAIGHLTGVPAENIHSTLLLASTLSAVEV